MKRMMMTGGLVLLATVASASSVWDYVTTSPRPKRTVRRPSVIEKGYLSEQRVLVEKPVTNVVEVVKVETVEVERPVTNVVEKIVEKKVVVEKPVEVEKIVEKKVVVEKPVEVEKIVTVEKPVTNTVEVVKVETVEVEKPVTNVVEKIVEKKVVVEKPVEVEKIVTVEKPVTNTVEVVKVETVEVEKPVTNVVEKIVEKKVVVEKPVEVEKIVTVEKPVTNTVEVVKVETVEIEKPVTNVVEVVKVVEHTNIVEKVIYDRGVEMRLAREKAELERRGGALEVRNAGLEKHNDVLQRELAEERTRRERLERIVNGSSARTNGVAKTGRPAKITSHETYYDRKKGVAYFEGKVHVDDEQYQLHADKAYVFTTGSNDVRRIVAVGHVAMTNENRRAYGGKVSYYRQDGMVVLYSGGDVPAEVRDESKAEDQSVRGRKIKFWIGNQQIEVLDATIVAPNEGTGGMGALGL